MSENLRFEEGGNFAEQELEADAALLEVGLLGGHLDGVAREIARKPGGFEQGLARHDACEQARAVQVAGAVQHVGDELVVHLEGVALNAADEVADLVLAFALDALQHDVLRALRDERVDEVLRLIVGDVRARPLAAEDEGRSGT